MSALAGIYNLDGTPVGEEPLTTLGKALESRGPDGGLDYRAGSVGMAYRAFHTNKESRLETQPLLSKWGQILCWDGRLDNRKELIAQLLDELCGDQSDVAIVMAAYLKWGKEVEDFLPRLVGDFALSLWDAKRRTLILSRDPVGTRTLYYQANEARLIWSSELTALVDILHEQLEISDKYVAEFLVGDPEPGSTPYIGISSVLPGHTVIASGGNTRVQRFWQLNPGYEIRYTNDEEYEEHFRHLFRESVASRLRADTPVWCELSGGLDSSSVVCMADEIVKSGDAQTPKIATVSYVFDDSSSTDERKFIRYVEDHIGNSGYHVREKDYRTLNPLTCESTSFVSIPTTAHCFGERHLRVCEAMERNGGRVLLTGLGGDELLCSREDPYALLGDLLVQHRLREFFHYLRYWNETLSRSYVGLLRDAILPLLPPRLQMRFAQRCKLPSYFDNDFATRMNLREIRLGPPEEFGFRLPSARDQAAGFVSVVRIISAGRFREWGHVEVSHPYLHRPLVEFLQAIPHEQNMRRGEPRSLQRRALRNLLPEKIAKRRGKGTLDEAFYRALVQEWSNIEPMFEDARIFARGYVNREALLSNLNRAKHGLQPEALSLVKTLALEFWLQALERRGLIAKSAVELRRSASQSAAA